MPTKRCTITEDMVREMKPLRPEDGHKGTFGMALLIAGSKDMTGAQALMTGSCLRSGVGLTKVFAPENSMSVTRVLCPCAIFESFGDTPSSVLRQYKNQTKVTSVGIGPGLDEGDIRNIGLLSEVIKTSKRLVIDAGALNIISKYKQEFLPLLKSRMENNLEPAVLTPHVGEFRRLVCQGFESESEMEEMACQFSLENKCILVLKKHKTIITTPDGQWYISCVGNDGMAKGGSGDVLTGLITGFMAQGLNSAESAISGVYIHGRTGDIMAETIGKRAMLPSDMEEYLPETFNEVEW